MIGEWCNPDCWLVVAAYAIGVAVLAAVLLGVAWALIEK